MNFRKIKQGHGKEPECRNPEVNYLVSLCNLQLTVQIAASVRFETDNHMVAGWAPSAPQGSANQKRAFVKSNLRCGI